MQHSDFKIGTEFTYLGQLCRCTDTGTRVVVYIEIGPVEFTSVNSDTREVTHGTLTVEEAESQGWFRGPSYAVVEYMIDENDIEICEPIEAR